MLRSEAISEIKRGLGFRQTQDTTIIAALQEAQRILELGRTLPSWLIAYDTAIAATNAVATITLPSNFIRFHDDYEFYYINSSAARVFIPRKNYTEAYTAYVASGEEDESAVIPAAGAYPKVFVSRGKLSGVLIPTPTVSFTGYLTYYKHAALLTADVENEWLLNAPEVIIGLAGMSVAGTLRDKDAMAKFTMKYKAGQGSFLGDIIEDELAGRPLLMGRNN